jgi:hypothetical protein
MEVSFTLRPLYHRGKTSGTQWTKGCVGPQSLSGRCGEVKILPCRERNACQPACGSHLPDQADDVDDGDDNTVLL